MQNGATEKKNRLDTIIKAENQFVTKSTKIPDRKITERILDQQIHWS